MDYFADPDRRPFGFRLKNGAVLQRGASNPPPAGVNIDPDSTVFGLSFITDNTLFIQGDFNLHQTSGGIPLEEFDSLVSFNPDGSYSGFYGRTRDDEDRRFARAADDQWRPTDVVADSVNILSDNYCDGSLDDGFLQDGTLNRGGNSYNPDRNFNNGRTSAPRRVADYGCTDAGIRGAEALGNTSFINQPLVFRGQNWPANDPNDNGAGVRRFDNTQESQELGNVTTQPGHPDVFARDTAIRSVGSGFDLLAGRGEPFVRDIRPPDRRANVGDPSGYIGYPTRISNAGNPVLDTSRWVQTSLACPNPGGAGLTAEYYNGWLNNAVSANGTTGDPAYDRSNSATNRPFLKAVRIPDPAFSSLTQFLYQWGTASGASDLGQPFRIAEVPTFGSVDCDYDGSDPAFLRSCWTRIVGTTANSQNDNGRRYFGTRWIGQLFPLFPGRVTYRVDGAGAVRLRIFANPAYAGPPIATALSPNPGSGIREQWNGDDNSRNAEVTGSFECSPSRTESPYLIEIQQLRRNANTRQFRLVARPDGAATPAGGYPLSYLRPIPTDNVPCQPDTSIPLLTNQEYCQTTCQVTFGPINAPLCPAVICGNFTLDGTRTRTETCPDGTVTTTTIPVPDATICNQQNAENCGPYGPECVFPINAGQTITQTRTCNPTSTCPGAVPTPTLSQDITCTNTCNEVFTDFGPPCEPLVNGGQTINQTRTGTRNCQDGSITPITDPALLNTTTTCPTTCSYDNPPFTPDCASDARSNVCGNGFTITQSRTRNLIAATSSPTCAATETQTNNLNCPQQPCGPQVSLPDDLRPDSPLRGNGLQASVGPQQTNEPLSLGTVAQSVVNWFLGEPAHAAEQGIQSTLLNSVSNPARPPGIRPAEAPGQLNDLRTTLTSLGISYTDNLGGLTPQQQEEFARSARRVFMQCPNDDFPTDLVDALGRIDGGAAGNGVFFVPGVFQPNFNTTFGYTAYDGNSVPSTLRYNFTYGAADIPTTLDPSCPDPNADNVLTQAERQAGNCRFLALDDVADPLDTITDVFDRDPLFGYSADADGLIDDPAVDFQPQMYLNPYARVTNNNTQNYTLPAEYFDGYYIDESDPGRLSNGLCFYVRVNSGLAQIRIDRNGNNNDGLEWVDVESISRDNLNRTTTNPSTGYAGTNPLWR
ncbi:MAG: hypothetical protein HC924_11375 [Synechococcaceae cyanobacterium SM2_3_2]|nr:hypothetical protein [Synechococcaceae cyanobacterium SM2_3_2]